MAVHVGQLSLVPPVEPGADRHTWGARFASIKEELASEPVESLGDLLRLGEKVLAATGLDVEAEVGAGAGDAAVSKLAPRFARARELLFGSETEAEIRPRETQQVAADLRMLVREAIETAYTARARIAPATAKRPASKRATALRAQGAYYVVSGLWAVVDRRGFETVTGRKTDYWLVRTVGLLAAAIGLSLLAGARGTRLSSETTVLGVAAGASFTAVDLVYVARRRISPIYLGDAAVHALLAGFALRAERQPAS